MKTIIVSSLILGITLAAHAAGPGEENKDSTSLKTFSAGVRMLHLYDLPSSRYDTPLNPDMQGLNGANTHFDLGFDVYVEKQFTPLLGAQLGFRLAGISGANDVEYFQNTFTQGYLDMIFILSNLDFLHNSSRWNFYGKAGIGYGQFKAEQFLIVDDATDGSLSGNFRETHLGAGIQYEVNTYLRLELESNYNIAQNDGFDGYDHGSGSDPYLTTALGITYTFGQKQNKPMYATNYFGEEYLPTPAPVVARAPKPAAINQEEIEMLKSALEQQEHRIAASERQLMDQQRELNALKEALKPQEQSIALYFDFDSSVLTPEAKKLLAQKLAILKSKESPNVELLAYADNNGSSAYNDQLKQRRAENVRRFMVESLGLAGENISIIIEESLPLPLEDQFLNRKVLVRY